MSGVATLHHGQAGHRVRPGFAHAAWAVCREEWRALRRSAVAVTAESTGAKG